MATTEPEITVFDQVVTTEEFDDWVDRHAAADEEFERVVSSSQVKELFARLDKVNELNVKSAENRILDVVRDYSQEEVVVACAQYLLGALAVCGIAEESRLAVVGLIVRAALQVSMGIEQDADGS